MKNTRTNPIDAIAQELRRGVLVLAILASLENEQYGYSLREELAEGGLEVAEGTLYPLLRRLESQGLLESRWQMGEGRPRRYYRRSGTGSQALERLSREWSSLVGVIAPLVGGHKGATHGTD